MIPRIIHTAWFGRGEKADHFKRCIESWHAVHPDWEFMEMNEDTLPEPWRSSPYIQGVLSRGEWVKATELARLVSLAEFGGVYMDCDVETVRTFERFRNDQFFAGFVMENGVELINGAVMGSQKGSHAASFLLANFPALTEGAMNTHVYGPTFIDGMLRRLPPNVWTKYPPEFFYPYHWTQTPEQAEMTPNTHAVHHWAKSWVGKY